VKTPHAYTSKITVSKRDVVLPLATGHLQELTQLSTMPLHGVSLVADSQRTCDTPFQLQLNTQQPIADPVASPIWQLKDEGERYSSLIELYQAGAEYTLTVDCEGRGRFLLKDNALTIDWHTSGTGPAHYMQTMLLSLYLELRQILCLHANTLVCDNQASLFLAPSRTGKSTLTTAMQRHGYDLTTDDMAALYPSGTEYQVYPSWPKVRLWPDSAEFLQDYAQQPILNTKKVHERFAKQEVTLTEQTHHHPSSLRNMFYLNRSDSPTARFSVTPIAPSAGLIILLQNSMLGSGYRALGIEKARLSQLANLLNTLPFYKVTYPSGLAQLPSVCRQLHQFMQENAVNV
jgi:hypothetical protein